MHPIILPVLLCATLAAVVIGFFQFFGHYIYNVRLTDNSLEFSVLYFWRVLQVPYSDILDIRLITRKEAAHLNPMPFSFRSRLLGKLVYIKSKSAYKHVLIAPPNPDKFIINVQKKLKLNAT